MSADNQQERLEKYLKIHEEDNSDNITEEERELFYNSLKDLTLKSKEDFYFTSIRVLDNMRQDLDSPDFSEVFFEGFKKMDRLPKVGYGSRLCTISNKILESLVEEGRARRLYYEGINPDNPEVRSEIYRVILK